VTGDTIADFLFEQEGQIRNSRIAGGIAADVFTGGIRVSAALASRMKACTRIALGFSADSASADGDYDDSPLT